MTTSHRMTHLRSGLASRRRGDRLTRELAQFRTTAERAELAAILDRHSDTDTAALRERVDVTAVTAA